MFYTYVQNNSGGWFVDHESLSHYVIIEADSPEAADLRAEGVGIYFDGCDDGIDCPCCGDRWYRATELDADEVPSLWGDPVGETVEDSWTSGAHIYYLNGEHRLVPAEG